MTKIDITPLLQKLYELNNRGIIAGCESYCTQLLDAEPNHLDVLLQCGRFRYKQKNFAAAAELLAKALKIDPNHPGIRVMLFASYKDGHDYEQMITLARQFLDAPGNQNELALAYTALLDVCDWSSAKKIESRVLRAAKSGKIEVGFLPAILLLTNGLPRLPAKLSYQLHTHWGRIYSEGKKTNPPKQINGRIRVAYISGDFYRHPVGFFMLQIIASHHREEFEVFCYAHLAGRHDEVTDMFMESADHFIDISNMDDPELLAHMHRNQIHIAVDLSSHTIHSRTPAFAKRLAPIQISYLGYPNTTGLKEMDFHITDHFAEDTKHGTKYSEELLFMPKSFLCYGMEWDVEKKTVAPCEETGSITFASFNDSRKLNLDVVKVWATILKQVKNSRLLLKFVGSGNSTIQHYIHMAFAKFGIDQARVEMLNRTASVTEHILNYHNVDIVLDPFPYTGTTTTCEALSQGVPVITLVGAQHSHRVSYSILKNIGFEETIAYSIEEYINKAVQFANNPKGLSILRGCLPLLLKHSPLRNTQEFITDLEGLYKDACKRKGIKLTHSNIAQHHNDEKQKNIIPTQSKKQINKKRNQYTTPDKITINIEGNIKIVVPNNLNLMTPYVLTEQHDWFEDEIKFIRKLIKPGIKVLDIGANYGCYTLTLAKLIGEKGHLWAFEPASSTASFLSESIHTNGFKNISLIKAALSNCKGTANLSLDPNSELNSITVKSNSGVTESVPLLLLDDCIQSCQWHDIEFVKLDAEGEEIHILEGGTMFFSQFSPLVMYELKHGNTINEGLIQKFESMGYQSYSLIPGLQLLAPFNHQDSVDGYLLNLFCCKKDTAQSLANAGFLIQNTEKTTNNPNTNWQQALSKYPYTKKLIATWKSETATNPLTGWDIYELALNHYTSAFSSQDIASKLSHLQQSFVHLVALLDIHATVPRVMTLIRVATELGHRSVSVQLLNQLMQESNINLSEPFLAVSQTAEKTNPDGRLNDWYLASILAEKEKLQAFSSYFTGQSSLPDIEHYLQLGYPDDAILERCRLIRKRYQTPNQSCIPLH